MRPIFDEVVAAAPKEVIEQLPPIKTCLNTMRMQRKRADPTPTAPVSRDGWSIPSKYQTATIGGEEYCTLAFDSGLTNPDRIICYFNPAALQELNTKCSEFHISLDGTFDYCAQRWTQQYTCLIKSPNSGKRFPIFLFLLPNKKFETYYFALSKLKDFLHRPVASCTLDFEPAAVSAVEAIFPHCTISLCYFHLCKNLIKQFKNLKLLQDEIGFKAYYNMASLPLLPPGLVLKGLDAAVSEIDVRQAALVKAYFINTYVGEVFKPARWCTRYRVHANLARTNNDIEGFHSTIASKFNRTHPVFWTWADAVNNSMAGVYVDVVHAIRGDKHVRHPIDVIHDARIQEFVFTNVPTIDTDMAEWLSKARAITRAVAPRPEDNRQPTTDGFPSPQPPTSQATSYAPEEDTVRIGEVAKEFLDASQASNSTAGASQPASTKRRRRGTVASTSSTTGRTFAAPDSTIVSRVSSFLASVRRNSSRRLSGTLYRDDLVGLLTTGSFVGAGAVDEFMCVLKRQCGDILCEPHPLSDFHPVSIRDRGYPQAPQGDGMVLQPLHVDRCHFIGMVRSNGQVYLIDSLSMDHAVSADVRQIVTHFFASNPPSSPVVAVFLGLQQQSPLSNLCAVHVLARFVDIILGTPDFSDIVYDESQMREHAYNCIADDKISPFPRASTTEASGIRKSVSTPVLF